MNGIIFGQMLLGIISFLSKLPFVWLACAFLLLAGAMTTVIVMATQKEWTEFALRHKWASRIILFVPSMIIVVALLFFLPSAAYLLIPGKITMESPVLTTSAIELGISGLYMQHAIAGKVPPGKAGAVKCIWEISYFHAQNYQNTCSDDLACFEHIPPMTKDVILAKIKDVQLGKAGASKSVVDLCKGVDASKL